MRLKMFVTSVTKVEEDTECGTVVTSFNKDFKCTSCASKALALIVDDCNAPRREEPFFAFDLKVLSFISRIFCWVDSHCWRRILCFFFLDANSTTVVVPASAILIFVLYNKNILTIEILTKVMVKVITYKTREFLWYRIY